MTKKLDDDSKYAKYDADGDGVVSDKEFAQAETVMKLEHEETMLENEDKKADAQRNMAWFALFGMLLYPFAVVIASLIGLETAAATLGDMAPTYFVSVAAIVAAFYAGQALGKN